MRARNLKPGFFKNELLGSSDAINGQIFQGLWCLSDREGRLEDRPLRIHAEINPYRNPTSTVQALDWLVLNGFVIRYVADGVKYLCVSNFKEHQQPHIKEAPSRIPEPPKVLKDKEHVTSTMQAPDKNSASTEVAALTPDSPFLTPDSPLLIPPANAVDQGSPVFDEIRRLYPKRSGSHRWQDAENAFRARLRENYTADQILDGVKRYAAHVRREGTEGTSYVQQAATFIGKNKGFLEEWGPAKTKAQAKQQANIDASLEWLGESHAPN